MSRRWSLVAAPLALALAACGGLTDEERQAAMGGALIPDAGAADRSARLAAEADLRRKEAAEAAELARIEKAEAENERRREILALANAQRARAEFPEGIEQLVEPGDDGPALVRENDREYERWADAGERRARAMRERAERYERRHDRETRARLDREERLREREYLVERPADEWRSSRRDRGRDRNQARWDDVPPEDGGYGVDVYRR